MRILFAGEELAGDETLGGAVQGFLPSGAQQIQIHQPLRATWARPIARGNRLHTIPFTVHYPPAALEGEALQRLCTHFSQLPASGALIWIEDGLVTQCEDAVLASFTPAYRMGVARAVNFTFQGGEIRAVEGLLLTEDDDFLMTETGAILETEDV